jgi:hypothetical protein
LEHADVDAGQATDVDLDRGAIDESILEQGANVPRPPEVEIAVERDARSAVDIPAF